MIKLAQKAIIVIAISLVSMSSLSLAALVFAGVASAQSKLKKCRRDGVWNETWNNCFGTVTLAEESIPHRKCRL